MEITQNQTEPKETEMAVVQELHTYLLPWHPSLLLTSRCRSPSKRDFSSGEKESGNSTFYDTERHIWLQEGCALLAAHRRAACFVSVCKQLFHV